MLYDIWTVFWRDWVVLKHRMIKFILSRMVAPILYMVAFGWGLGRSINTGTGSYLDFLVPGILALNSMNIAFNSLTPVHAERIYHKSLEEYLVSPIRPIAFVAGKILAAVLRGMISSAIIVVLAYLFGAKFAITPLFIIILIINCIIFAEIGFSAAMTVQTFEDMARFNTYILLPMSFLCGTFFSTDKLPFARLGGASSFLTQLGDDPFGHKIARELEACGIDLSHLVFTDKANHLSHPLPSYP